MKGLILSGGKGTRLRPLTYTRAKQLMPLGNKPILIRVIETIRNAGVDEIGIVVGGSTAQEIKDLIGDGSQYGVSVQFIDQDSPDGLAHAVKISEEFIGDSPFVMFLGDNAIEGGISDLIKEFSNSDWNSQIVLKQVVNPSSYGVADFNPDGSIKRLIEKPENPPSDLALVGIYMFDQNIFKAVNDIKPSARGELEITDAIQWLLEKGYTVHPYQHQGWWVDTGKALDMLEANSHVLTEIEPSIAEDVHVDAHSVIDSRVTIESGATVENSVVRGPTIIGAGAVIRDSYVGPFTSIGNDVSIEGCEIERSIVLEGSEIIGVDRMIRDSLIGRDVTLRNAEEKKPRRGLIMNVGDNSALWV